MSALTRRIAVMGLVFLIAGVGAGFALRSHAAGGQGKTAAAKKVVTTEAGSGAAARFNTLGVAYMNQQRPADAQKYFAQAVAADEKFSVARLNLGIAFLGQQKLDLAREALLRASAEQI